MTLGDWIEETKERFQEKGPWTAAKWSASEFIIGGGRRLGQSWNYGTNVWNHQWDALILLDACRYDLFCEVAPEYNFLPDNPRAVYSAASMSEEWLERHTRPEFQPAMKQTALISGNAFPYLSDTVDPDEWAHVDNLVTHQWDEDHGIVLARSVTDATVDFWRNRRQAAGANRVIAWYIQPHAPFIPAEWSEGFEKEHLGNPDEGKDNSVWYQLRKGDITLDQLWTAYRDNLRYVLDDVELLLENMEAERVVITADHANCIGERGIYGHPKYVPDPTLKRVPWVELSATDRGWYEPEYQPPETEEQDLTDSEVDHRLKALGYK